MTGNFPTFINNTKN